MSFTIDAISEKVYPDKTPPVISVLSVSNETYGSIIPLNFSLNEPTSWIGYSLDNQANMTINGNTTLTGLTYGSHNLVVYANDTSGNMGSSETINFSIAEEPEPFPTTLVVASVASVAVVGVGLLVYFKKRKR